MDESRVHPLRWTRTSVPRRTVTCKLPMCQFEVSSCRAVPHDETPVLRDAAPEHERVAASTPAGLAAAVHCAAVPDSAGAAYCVVVEHSVVVGRHVVVQRSAAAAGSANSPSSALHSFAAAGCVPVPEVTAGQSGNLVSHSADRGYSLRMARAAASVLAAVVDSVAAVGSAPVAGYSRADAGPYFHFAADGGNSVQPRAADLRHLAG